MDGKAATKLFFADTLRIDDLMLFEMPEELVTELSEVDSGTFQIRGQAGDKASLVSSDKTFSVRQVESTNLMLLVPPSGDGEAPTPKRHKKDGDGVESKKDTNERKITGIVTCHYEISEINPDLTHLRKLLSKRTYAGNDKEGDGEGKEEEEQNALQSPPPISHLYSTQQLQRLVQASNAQLREGLRTIGALELNGVWRLLDPDYAADIFDMILTIVDEKQLSLNNVDCGVVCTELEREYPPTVVRHVLRQHSREDEHAVFSLDEAKTCVFRAHQLFAEREPYPCDEFNEEWRNIVPYGMEPQENFLKGHAIVEPCAKTDKNKCGMQYKYFPVSALSPDPEERFRQLFTARERWTEEEIQPYTIDLVLPGQKFDRFLLHHARSVTTAAGVLYTKLL